MTLNPTVLAWTEAELGTDGDPDERLRITAALAVNLSVMQHFEEGGDIARAALESIAFATRDVLDAMQRDAGIKLDHLKVDGGASRNALLMQFQADLLGVAVRRPVFFETTALGAACLAGLAVDFWHDQATIAANWKLDQEFQPAMAEAEREHRFARWRKAVERSLDWAVP